MSAVASMLALTGLLGGVPTTERYFALFGAGGAGGSMDTSSNDLGAAGGNGAFMEIKVEGIPSGMVFNMVCGDGGSASSRNSAGGAGGGGGSASILRCQYNGANVLLAVAGAGGGGGGGGQSSGASASRAPTPGAGASSTSEKQTDAEDRGTPVRGGHTADVSSSPSMSSHGTNYARLDPPTRETYAQDGGAGARSQGGGVASDTPLGGANNGGSLPTASWGGQGGDGGLGNANEGGGGGGGGGYYGGCGGTGGSTNGSSGVGGGGGSSYVRSGSVSIGGATLTVTLVQEKKGLHQTQTTVSTVWDNQANDNVQLEYMSSADFALVGVGGDGGRNELSNTNILSDVGDGAAGRIQMHSDTALIQANTSGGTQADVTI